MTLSRCPFCGARGVRMADRRIVDGVPLQFDYCGKCGKNWPPHDRGKPDRVPETVAVGPWPGSDGDAA